MKRFATVLVLGLALVAWGCDSGGGDPVGGTDVKPGTDVAAPDDDDDPCVGLATCMTAGTVQCSGNGVQTCTAAGACLVWSDPVACAAGQTCTAGICSGTCTANCTGKTCGDDGCGGSCGTCTAPETCSAAGVCEGTCTANCTGKLCGDDGCGGSCGTCPAGETCINATGQCEGCDADCTGKECGDDGCGGSCGTCGQGQECDATGQCIGDCVPDCEGKQCGGNGCGAQCGFCPAGEECVDGACEGCQPQCTDRECGDDGCGGACGECGANERCEQGECLGCTPACAGRECGGDGCGGSCGECGAGEACEAGLCEGCAPACGGKQCGDDGCGGSCGTCADGKSCVQGLCLCLPQCTGKECGDDGCGGSCGTCPVGEACGATGQCEGCTPNCTGKACGDNGCGGTCGTCDANESCNLSGQCIANVELGNCSSFFDCYQACDVNDTACGDACFAGLTPEAQQQVSDYYGCLGTSCADCETDADPNACYMSCIQFICTDAAGACFYDGGTGSCNDYFTCTDACTTDECYGACDAQSSPQGFADRMNWIECALTNCPICNTESPTEAEITACNTCIQDVAGGVCNAQAYACFAGTCEPDCTGRTCGDDGCGGSCGTCTPGQSCSDAGTCVACVPDCAGRTCGSNGCGGVCGTCPAGQACTADGACIVSDCDYVGFTSVEGGQFATYGESEDGSQFALQYFGQSAMAAPADLLEISLWTGAARTPGTYAYNAAEGDDNYATCPRCVLAYQGCDESTCAKYFYWTAGSITITQIGGVGDTFGGTVSGVEMVEVTIGEGAVTTPVPGGETWCIEGYSFLATLEQAQ